MANDSRGVSELEDPLCLFLQMEGARCPDRNQCARARFKKNALERPDDALGSAKTPGCASWMRRVLKIRIQEGKKDMMRARRSRELSGI